MDANEIRRFDNTQLANHLGLQIITDSIDEALVLADGNGELIDFNPAAIKIHGFKTKEEAFARIHDYPNLFELQHFEGGIIPFEEWPLIRILKGEVIKDMEVRLIRKDFGAESIVSYGGTPIFKENKLVLAVMHIRDIRAKKEAEMEMKKAVRARDEFLSLASHELRTPLTSLNLLSRLQRELAGEIDRADNLKRVRDISVQIEKNVDWLGRLVEEMLDVSRIQNQKFKIRREKVHLKALVLEIIFERMQSEFTAAGYTVPVVIGADVEGFWDRMRIEQVVVNLLTNAIRYGSNNSIEIEIQDLTDKAILKVKDHGIGISEEQYQRIFEPFERIAAGLANSGLGVGLYITRQIVTSHQGRIWVESKPDFGSTFFVELPIA